MDVREFSRSQSRSGTRQHLATWLGVSLLAFALVLILLTRHPAARVNGTQAVPASPPDSMVFTVWYVDDESFGTSLKMAHVVGKQGNRRLEDVKTLLQIDNSESINEFAVSPSQDSVLVSANPSVPFLTNVSQLWLISTNRKRRVIRSDMAGYINLRWSGNESLISYISNEGASQGSGDTDSPVPENLYIHNLATNKRARVMMDTYKAEWIPVTDVLASTSLTKTGIRLSTFNGKHSTIESGTQGGTLVLSQDGTSLLVNDIGYLGGYRLTKGKHADEARGWQLVHEYSIPWEPEAAALSSDGRFLALSVLAFGMSPREPRQLAILDLQEGLGKMFGTIAGPVHRLKWSSDGRYLLYTSYSRAGRDEIPLFRLSAMSVASGHWVPVQAMDWSALSAAKPTEIIRFPPKARQVEWREDK